MMACERVRSSSSRFHGLLISDLAFTNTVLGRGSDATVYEVEWNGTVCAAKRLHEVLLEDQSPGGAEKLIGNFEAECLTWSKLRHPGVVQFLGVYLERSYRLPVLAMEKMDVSLRIYLEGHSKEEFPLHLKAFVLRQVTQALAYLHNQNPPLVHHDLSTNNVLLNVASFVTKVSDFGMSRAINTPTLSRKSSVKGTPTFMAPEALHNPPRYDEKLDVFSFGNIILSTVTHEWPDPDPPNQYEGNCLVALNELQRRYHHVAKFTAEEKQLFLPTVNQCLENRPDMRPSSAVLVKALRRIETFISGGHVAAPPIQQLCHQLSTKEDECRECRESLRDKDAVIRAQQADIQQLRDQVAVAQQIIQCMPVGGWYEGMDTMEHLDVADRESVTADLHMKDTTLLRSLSVPNRPLEAFQSDCRTLLGKCFEGDLTESAPSSLSSDHSRHKRNGLKGTWDETLLSGTSSSTSSTSPPPTQLPLSNRSSSPVGNGDEVEDGGACTVQYVNEAMIEQQLETRIYQMSREEAKTALSSEMVDGMFLLRVSKRSGMQLVISVWYQTECKHFKIFHDKEKGFSLTRHTFFDSVTSLIHHYKRENLPKSTFHLSVPCS